MMKFDRKRARPTGKPWITAPAHLSPEHQAAFLTMNDDTASPGDRMVAALALLPVMHAPLPPVYVGKARARMSRVHRSAGTP